MTLPVHLGLDWNIPLYQNYHVHGVTLSVQACKQVILNVSETGLLTLIQILMACKRSHY